MTRTRRRFLGQLAGGATLAAAAPSFTAAQSPTQRLPPGAGCYRTTTALHARPPLTGPSSARSDRESIETFQRRVACARAHYRERREDRMGADCAIRGRHLRAGAASPDRAAGDWPRHQRNRCDQRRRDRCAAEVPVVVPLPRARRCRHRALGSLRADHRQARGGSARRVGAAAARLRIEHAPRHQPRRRGHATGEAPRSVRVQGIQDPARHAGRSQP